MESIIGTTEYLCVPAVVSSAVYQLTGRSWPVPEIARELGVQVLNGWSNPHGLGVTHNLADVGITLAESAVRIPEWLAKSQAGVAFEEVPNLFGSIEQIVHLVSAANRRGDIMAATLDWARLYGGMVAARHVVILELYGLREVSVYDSTQAPERQRTTFPTRRFDIAMDQVDGVFWRFFRS